MKIGEKGLSIVKHYEQLHDGDLKAVGLQPKQCPAGIWTVGYGRALRDSNGKFLRGEAGKAEAYRRYPALSERMAVLMLAEDTAGYERQVTKVLTEQHLTLSQDQFDALISLTYNCGIGALYDYANKREMSVLRAIKSGDKDGITKAFGLWNKAGGKVQPGLTFRRQAEACLYNTGEVNFNW